MSLRQRHSVIRLTASLGNDTSAYYMSNLCLNSLSYKLAFYAVLPLLGLIHSRKSESYAVCY
jgi:hypothetical protein